jgi:predicted MFS family arabinose efflux permease
MTISIPTVSPRVPRAMVVWFWSIFALFFTRGVLLATWSNRGPEIRETLNLDLPAMGWYAACLSVGAVTGVLLSERLVGRFGSRNFSLFTYSLMGTALVLLGLNLEWKNVLMSFLVTALLGLPLGMADYDNNLEASNIDRESPKSRVPALSGGFSVGVLLGALLVGVVSTAGMGITPNFISIGLIIIALSAIASLFIGKTNGRMALMVAGGVRAAKISFADIARESRSRRIAVIAFAFVFAEGVGVVWIPVALVQNGFPPALAAFGYTLFGLGFVVMRFVGGPITDRIGRRNVVFFSAITASVGIIIFIFTPVLGIPLLGILLWGLGDSIGLAMCIAAMGDDETRVHARMTFLWTIVYVANIVVGPIIGQLSGAVGLMGALVAPLVFLVAAGLVSRAVGEAHPDAMVTATPTSTPTAAQTAAPKTSATEA